MELPQYSSQYPRTSSTLTVLTAWLLLACCRAATWVQASAAVSSISTESSVSPHEQSPQKQ